MSTADDVSKLSDALNDLKSSYDKTTGSAKPLISSFDQLHKMLAASPWVKYNETLLQVSRTATSSAIPLQSLTKVIDDLGKKTSLYSQQQIGELVGASQRLGSSLTGLTQITNQYLNVLVDRFPRGAAAANQQLQSMLAILPELQSKTENFTKVTFDSATAMAVLAKGGPQAYASYRQFTIGLSDSEKQTFANIKATQELGVEVQNLGLRGSKGVAPLLDGMAKIGSLGASNPFTQWFTGLETVNKTADTLLGTVLKIAGVLSIAGFAKGGGGLGAVSSAGGGGAGLGLMTMLGAGTAKSPEFGALGERIGGASAGFFSSRLFGSSVSAEAGIGSKLLSSMGGGLKYAGKGLPLIGAALAGLSSYSNTGAETSWADIFKGAGKSALGGGAVGAGLGAFAGGVGAIPGAIAGALVSGGGDLIGGVVGKLTSSKTTGTTQEDAVMARVRKENEESYKLISERNQRSGAPQAIKDEQTAMSNLLDLHERVRKATDEINSSKDTQAQKDRQIGTLEAFQFETIQKTNAAIQRAGELRAAESSILQNQISAQEQLGAMYGQVVRDKEKILANDVRTSQESLKAAAIVDPSKMGVEYKQAYERAQGATKRLEVFEAQKPLEIQNSEIMLIEKKNQMTKNSVEILRTMNAPLQQIMQQEGMIVDRLTQKESKLRNQLEYMKQARDASGNALFGPQAIATQEGRLSSVQAEKAQEVQYARRTYLEQMTSQSFGLSTGSYVLPTELPGVMALGGGYQAFRPAGEGERYGGTYTSMHERLAGKAGIEGMSMSGDWRTLGEQDTEAALDGNELLSENNEIMKQLTEALKSLKVSLPSSNNAGSDGVNQDSDEMASHILNH